MLAPPIKHWRTTFERIDKFISEIYFKDVNITKLIYVENLKIENIYHFNEFTIPNLSVKDSFQLRDDSALDFHTVIYSDDNKWEKVDIGNFIFKPTWSIHWFKLKFYIPNDWIGKENHIIELHWDSGCEVLVFSSSGQIIKGLNSTHGRTTVDLRLLCPTTPNNYVVYLQASCSDLFGAGDGGLINPPLENKTFKIESAQLRLLFKPALVILRDLRLLLQIAEAFKEKERGYQALYAGNSAIDTIIDLSCDVVENKISKAKKIIDIFFQSRNGSSQVTLHSIGHCHIDTAWLWRYGETRRKIARSWSTTLQLMKDHPKMKFVCSQAQQMQWLKDDYHDLFFQLQSMAQRNQFIPVGGTWVEMDVNLPCCESICRQFLYGQRFFRSNFGKYCREFWLPDTFGYSPQLPQIMRLSGISRFVTQKLSWSLVNKFPHHSFLWQGLDGSTVITHFPPGDSYSMTAKVSEIIYSATNFADKGRSSDMMYIYGHGDGGQGPDEEMLYNLDRLEDCDGLPRVQHSTPDQFFDKIEANDIEKLCTWRGELFLELHNGTYTTQRQLKLGNTQCEQMLRAVELVISIGLCQLVSGRGDLNETMLLSMVDQVEFQWKIVLLNQFHDVLPGSSIEHACDDAYWSHQSVISWCKSAINTLAMELQIPSPFYINTTSWGLPNSIGSQTDSDDISYKMRPHSIGTYFNEFVENDRSIEYMFDNGTHLHKLSNKFVRISVDDHCRITDLQLISSQTLGNLIPQDCPANQLLIYDDVPLFWDAWDVMDYHLETGIPIDKMPSFQLVEKAFPIIEDRQLVLTAKFCLSKTGTLIEQSIILNDHREYVEMRTKILEWRETHRIIKVRIPTVANTTEAQFRTQGGYHSRPTHRNTSWDTAKYEVCSHEWLHLGEVNWGISVLKDSIFGCSVREGTIFLSLLRSTSCPDPTADKKHLPHCFNYAIYPHCSLTDVNWLATTSRLASQFIWIKTWENIFSNQAFSYKQNSKQHFLKHFPIELISPSKGEVSIDWIKPTCDHPRKFVLRLHEQIGGRYNITLFSSMPLKHAGLANILEEYSSTDSDEITFSCDTIKMFILPFKIVSIIIEFL